MRGLDAREAGGGVTEPDPVEHPAHYVAGGAEFEAIRVIERWQLGFCLGNAVKYIARASHKGNERTDLRKARWYLLRWTGNDEPYPNGSDPDPRDVAAAWQLPEPLAYALRCIAHGRISDAADGVFERLCELDDGEAP